MEKAILKTLIYANIFEYPLKGYEVFKWLVKKETSLLKVEKSLNKLIKKKKISLFKDYYFLPKYKKIVSKRIRHEKYSKQMFRKAMFFANFLKLIPWIKLVGISGGLALFDADKKDDIDLFLITSKNKLWTCRILTIFLLDLLRVRRTVNMKNNLTSGKICLNTILDEDHLEQKFQDLYVAHEVLQMKVLWQRKGIYSKFLKDNDWTFNFLPNWTSRIKYLKSKTDKPMRVFNFLESLAKDFQLKIMKKAAGLERIEEGALYFYPNDYRKNILKSYAQKSKRFN